MAPRFPCPLCWKNAAESCRLEAAGLDPAVGAKLVLCLFGAIGFEAGVGVEGGYELAVLFILSPSF